ncbi:hypothetical protein [Chitinophaga sp. Cy-1792]|uniref:hypothetical protein n=1 Tax=Chitinophaga sp. Cy-1792 TaxID=2608339 RepID=UPI00141F583A|nr:hypothetical protein [Chitinophaga sp. Cy-1792]NIG55288.1 hypothetical protein [Chitinophaga sp. Cy-1792]
MKRASIPGKYLAAVLLPVFFTACSTSGEKDNTAPEPPKPAPVYEIPKTHSDTVAFLYSRTMGLDSTAITSLGSGSMLIDGDMTMEQATLTQLLNNLPIVAAKDSTKSVKSPYVVNKYKVFKIGDNPGQLAAGVESALYKAIGYWNGILIPNGAEFNFMVYSDPAPSDIMFSTGNFNQDVPFLVSLPNGAGLPGSSITLNMTYMQKHNVSNDQLVAAMVHALGHVLGLQHSNRKKASYYDAGNIGDLESVMNADFPKTSHAKYFSKGDTVMVKRLFPAPDWAVQGAGDVKELAGIEITSGDAAMYYRKDGKVVRGSWTNAVGPVTTFDIRSDLPANTVVDVAISGANRYYTYFNNGWLVDGEMYKLAGNPLNYYFQGSPAPGQSISTLVGVTIKKDNDDIYYFYNDGTYSVGRSNYWSQYSYGNAYTVPAGKSFTDIKAVAVDDAGRFYFWYKDNTVSRSALASHSSPEGPLAVKVN